MFFSTCDFTVCQVGSLFYPGCSKTTALNWQVMHLNDGKSVKFIMLQVSLFCLHFGQSDLHYSVHSSYSHSFIASISFLLSWSIRILCSLKLEHYSMLSYYCPSNPLTSGLLASTLLDSICKHLLCQSHNLTQNILHLDLLFLILLIKVASFSCLLIIRSSLCPVFNLLPV